MKNILFAAFSTALMAGCATTANYEAILQSWVGSSADDLVSVWGAPQSSFDLSNGGKIIEYHKQNNIHIDGYTYMSPQTTYQNGSASAYGPRGFAYGTYSGTSTTYVQKQTPGTDINLSCTTRFTVNSSGIITRWAWQGNHCKALKNK